MASERRKAKFVHIGGIINSVLKKYHRDTEVGLVQVWQIWESVVGPIIAQNARPAAFKGRILLVQVVSSTWIHQLRFLKAEIIEKLNQALNRPVVEDLKFKIGPVENDD